MRLANVEISNFRSIKHIALDHLEAVNVLIGPNGCGKTNILDALNHCFQKLLIDRSPSEESDFWFGTSDMIGINIEVTHDGQHFPVHYTKERGSKPVSTGHSESKYLGYYKYLQSDRVLRSGTIGLGGNRTDILSKFGPGSWNSDRLLYPYVDLAVNTPDRLKELARLIAQLYPGFTDLYMSFNIEKNNADLLAIINDYAFPVTHLASGLQQLIAMIVTIYYSKDNVILIDEPELHMNPAMIIGLARLIRDSAANNNNQFLLGTHSHSFISTPSFNIIPLEYKKTDAGYSTVVSESIAEEFVERDQFFKGEPIGV